MLDLCTKYLTRILNYTPCRTIISFMVLFFLAEQNYISQSSRYIWRFVFNNISLIVLSELRKTNWPFWGTQNYRWILILCCLCKFWHGALKKLISDTTKRSSAIIKPTISFTKTENSVTILFSQLMTNTAMLVIPLYLCLLSSWVRRDAA
jgi:hypothetical protein